MLCCIVNVLQAAAADERVLVRESPLWWFSVPLLGPYPQSEFVCSPVALVEKDCLSAELLLLVLFSLIIVLVVLNE